MNNRYNNIILCAWKKFVCVILLRHLVILRTNRRSKTPLNVWYVIVLCHCRWCKASAKPNTIISILVYIITNTSYCVDNIYPIPVSTPSSRPARRKHVGIIIIPVPELYTPERRKFVFGIRPRSSPRQIYLTACVLLKINEPSFNLYRPRPAATSVAVKN